MSRDWREVARNAFNSDMEDGYESLKTLGYSATAWLVMMRQRTPVLAAKDLMRGPKTSHGFQKLLDMKRLHMSAEYFMLKPWYQQLFEPHELEEARKRLILHEFDVDCFLDQESDPPAWWLEQLAEP